MLYNSTIRKIKKYQKLKEPIRIRYKKLKNGNASLYLDIYWKGTRSYQFLHLYLIPEIDELTKEQNYEVLKKALLIKSKRMITLIHSIPEQQKTSNIEKYNLIDFVQEYANERKPQTGKEGIGRYGSIISLKQHLIKFWSQEHLGESGGSEIHQTLHRVPEGSTRYSSTAEEPPQAIGWNHLSDVFNHEKHHVRAI